MPLNSDAQTTPAVSPVKIYQNYSPEDKAALKELKDQEEKRTGKVLQIRDLIMALEPGQPDPAYLKN